MPVSITIREFQNHGHKLANSDWSAWYAAYRYAAEFKPEVLGLIDKGCNYANDMKPVPDKYLNVAIALYNEAIK